MSIKIKNNFFKKAATVPLLLFCFMGYTQNDSTVYYTKLREYYTKHGLNVDSAKSQLLYYKAYEWIGTRYRYAGGTKKGIDCSGFVSEVYNSAYNIKLSGGSREIWPLTIPVPKDSLQEGDLLFFKIKKGKVSHVGLYLGNNKMVHASVKSGVIISDLNEDYYKKHYFSGGRIPAKK